MNLKLTPGHERALVLLIALHSLIIGLLLLAVPQWAMRFGGWPGGIDPTFFGRQAGIFHVVLVAGYLIEYFKYRGVTLLITAKCIAVVFLLLAHFLDNVPWAVPISGLGDGAMALVVWLLHRHVSQPQ